MRHWSIVQRFLASTDWNPRTHLIQQTHNPSPRADVVTLSSNLAPYQNHLQLGFQSSRAMLRAASVALRETGKRTRFCSLPAPHPAPVVRATRFCASTAHTAPLAPATPTEQLRAANVLGAPIDHLDPSLNRAVLSALAFDKASQAEINSAAIGRVVERFRRSPSDTGSPEVQGVLNFLFFSCRWNFVPFGR
jgi:hypothetical protein